MHNKEKRFYFTIKMDIKKIILKIIGEVKQRQVKNFILPRKQIVWQCKQYVGMVGFEPTAIRLKVGCSTN